MIRIVFTGVNWGVDTIDEGAQINLLDPDSNILAHAPFTGESLEKLVTELIGRLTDEQKQAVAPLLRNGLSTATPDDLKRLLGSDGTPLGGPQG